MGERAAHRIRSPQCAHVLALGALGLPHRGHLSFLPAFAALRDRAVRKAPRHCGRQNVQGPTFRSRAGFPHRAQAPGVALGPDLRRLDGGPFDFSLATPATYPALARPMWE
jgi:hypothetical protein